jgi:hypothetical protein
MRKNAVCRVLIGVVLGLVITAAAAPAANAQAIIKVSDTVNFRFGMLLQAWADEQQIPTATGGTDGYMQNLFLRRARFIMAGQIAKGVTFFMDTENANLGKATPATALGAQTNKALGTGFQLLDAYGSWEIAPEFAIQGGLILIPLCRDCNSSAAALLGLDYGLWSFQESAPTGSTIGRDTGFQVKGYFLKNHLEYRFGAYQGFRQTNAKNSFRYAGRVQYNVFDTETAQFYTTQYFATKKILAIGAGFDTQSSYNSFAGDITLNLPVGKDAVNFSGDYIHYDGSTFFTAPGIRKQNVIFVEGGYYISTVKLEPFAVYQQQDYTNSTDKVLNKRAIQAGLSYYPFGHNLNFKLAWTGRKFPNDPKTANTNEFTLQMQVFYF